MKKSFFHIASLFLSVLILVVSVSSAYCQNTHQVICKKIDKKDKSSEQPELKQGKSFESVVVTAFHLDLDKVVYLQKLILSFTIDFSFEKLTQVLNPALLSYFLSLFESSIQTKAP